MIETGFFLLAIIFQCDAIALPMKQNPSTLCASTALGSCSSFNSCCRRQCTSGNDITCVTTNGQVHGTCQCHSAGPDTGATNAPRGFHSTLTSRRTTSRPTFPTSQLPATGGNRNCGRRGSNSNSQHSRDYDSGEMKIIGGIEARPHSWPWQASLRKDNRHICGGSVIDSNHILTAAHCVRDGDESLYQVALGIHSISVQTTSSQVFDIDKITIHPNYDGHSYDAAILTVFPSISFSTAVGPVCIAQDDAPTGTNCYVTGWGDTKETGNNDHLQQVSIPLISRTTCTEDYSEDDLKVDSSMICAGTDGRDSCQGDSGGPLVRRLSDGRYELQGIVSWGKGCAMEKPGVYTRVSTLRDWINSETSRS